MAETETTFLKNKQDLKAPAVFKIEFVAKGTNSYGAIIQNQYAVMILNDENYTVLKME